MGETRRKRPISTRGIEPREGRPGQDLYPWQRINAAPLAATASSSGPSVSTRLSCWSSCGSSYLGASACELMTRPLPSV
jgi:hypothetical protein